jgi:hypothetical protein
MSKRPFNPSSSDSSSTPSGETSGYKISDWRRLSETDRRELENKLTPLLNDEKAFTRALIELGYPPPGTLIFRKDGRIEKVPTTRGVDRIANVIAIQAHIRGLEKHARNPHTIERHGTYVADEVLKGWDLGDSEPPTRFAEIVEMFSAIMHTTRVHRAKIEENCAANRLGMEDFIGPTVEYEGWSISGFVKGSAPTVVRLWFDGKGNWGLETAFPNP